MINITRMSDEDKLSLGIKKNVMKCVDTGLNKMLLYVVYQVCGDTATVNKVVLFGGDEPLVDGTIRAALAAAQSEGCVYGVIEKTVDKAFLTGYLENVDVYSSFPIESFFSLTKNCKKM